MSTISIVGRTLRSEIGPDLDQVWAEEGAFRKALWLAAGRLGGLAGKARDEERFKRQRAPTCPHATDTEVVLGGLFALAEVSAKYNRPFLPEPSSLDVRGCQQVDNRIVRDVLQHCEHLRTLRLDGCTRISDSAFAPALWKPPLAGLLGLHELSIGKCGQVTTEGLMGCVMKGAPFLKSLGLSFCRLSITDEVASELLFNFGIESLDLSFCTQVTDAAFEARSTCTVRELHVPNTQITDEAVESIARCARDLEVFDGGWVMKLTDRSVVALATGCPKLRSLCLCNTQITDDAFEAIARCRSLERLDASWCLRSTPHALEILAAGSHAGESEQCGRPPLRDLKLDHLGAFGMDAG
eukprot:CAMPEP_0170349874 /NCGR_PEP_ID=MMETSP0116_2-20130129/76230_1 /TAXON_ID=400756 /ORGANISM="Durinskia baltica, Strain CSIRO CS-38" /LENGTH=353 /DNA_ID=CAMNT_0010603763 /DNA_START=72 /DNA_END=1130 /DNA_ORIENTATION=-